MVKLDSVRVSEQVRRVQPLYKIRTGYFSIRCTDGNIEEFPDERPLATLPEAEQETIRLYTHIVYAMVFGVEDVLNENN
jgi:hypothetical protein